ncbi:MAG: biopolymer transport protein TolR [Candidatus Azotimanducaceae bacterium]|jgi:biopolymer transport protein TolR
MAKAKRRRPMSEINVVPYIDVMLVLLVIFMVTAPMITQGIKVDLPNAQSSSIDISDDEQALVVSIKADGSYFMNVGEEDEVVELSKISERARQIIEANPKVKVLVEGDEEIQYKVVIELMSILQAAGAKNVGLITEPPAV